MLPETDDIKCPLGVRIEDEKSPLESSSIGIDCESTLCQYKIKNII